MNLNPVEQACFDDAAYFTAVRGMGARRTKREFATLAEALAAAAEHDDKRTMIYAVDSMGGSAHILNA